MTRPLPSSSAMRTTPDVRASVALPFGRTSLEQLDDAGQTAGDVGAGDTTGVERPHRQLGAGLTDRLGGDHADRFAQFDRLAGRQRPAVALAAHAELGLTGERRAHPDAGDSLVVAQPLEVFVADLDARGDHGAVRQRDVVGERATEQPGLEVVALGAVGRIRPRCPRARGRSTGTPSRSQSSSRTISSCATSTRRRVR